MANGLATPSGLQTTNLTEIGEGRRTVVSLNLDRMADSVSGQTVVDPKGYLTDLKSIKVGWAWCAADCRTALRSRHAGSAVVQPWSPAA